MNKEAIIKELNFKAVRSGGAGGQHVNKVSSKVELIFDLQNSSEFTEEEKELLFKNLQTKLTKENILILTGHYKGVDQRIRDKYITKEISIGDYVLTGGELAAAVLVDAIVRLIPGVIGDEQSALTDSFQDNLLSPPVYTRPSEFEGMKVPEVLLSGNFPKIDDWRNEQAYKRTEEIRPDLLNDE